MTADFATRGRYRALTPVLRPDGCRVCLIVTTSEGRVEEIGAAFFPVTGNPEWAANPDCPRQLIKGVTDFAGARGLTVAEWAWLEVQRRPLLTFPPEPATDNA